MSAAPQYEDLSAEQKAAVCDLVRVYQNAYLGRPRDRSLTVISGPGGSGKTTIVTVALGKICDWLETRADALEASQTTNVVSFKRAISSKQTFADFTASAGNNGQVVALSALAVGAIRSPKSANRELAQTQRDAAMQELADHLDKSFGTYGAAYDF